MAVTLEEFARRFSNVKTFISEEIDRIVNKKASVVEEMQRRRLAKGKDIEKRTIQKGYSPGYAKRRKKRGLQTNYVDLNFTGEFYESLELKETPEPGEFQTVSYVDYAKYILDRYTSVLGISVDDSKKLKQIVLGELNKSVKRYLVG